MSTGALAISCRAISPAMWPPLKPASILTTTTFDAQLQPGFRWIELAPPGGGTSMALVTAGEDLPSGIDTGIRLTTPDARGARAALAAKALEVGELLDWESAPLMFSFRDLDANRFYVSQDD